MSIPREIQLGLCCLNTELREQKPTVFCSRTMIQKTVKEKGIDELKRRVLLNLDDLLKVIQWNEDNGIRVYRLSSEMFPHKTNPNVEQYTLDFAKEKLKKAGDLAKKYGHRLTYHPGQFNVLGTPDEPKLQHTINELQYHADVLNIMECDQNSVMVIHGGGLYGDKEKTKDRWCENYKKLPQSIRDRLVLENCERCFNIQDCLDISDKVHVPVVFDTHHFDCYNKIHPDVEHLSAEEYIPLILETWERRNIKPKFHVSEQGTGRIGHHSDYIEVIPDYLLEIPDKYDVEIDIMIEAKAKEKAILKLYKKYPHLNCKQMKVKKLVRRKVKQVDGENNETNIQKPLVDFGYFNECFSDMTNGWDKIIQTNANSLETMSKQLIDDTEYFKIYPPKELIFNSFKYFSPIDTRVIIIGQDPYHQPGQGNGLAFSVNDGIKHPPSLKNIFKEIYSDLGESGIEDCDINTRSGNLEYLAKQGVLLLNTTLTVRDSKPNSHVKIWAGFVCEVLKSLLSQKTENIVFMVWGGNAQSVIDKLVKQGVNMDSHKIIKCNHPSPLSANRGGWFGTKPFSKCNEYLDSKDIGTIDWMGSLN